jgi:hypothetical protein
MAWFKKKADPISERARALNQEIAALEARIREMDKVTERVVTRQKELESSPPASSPVPAAPAPRPAEPKEVFEDIDQDVLETRVENIDTPAHFNELGVRKYDFPAFLRRIKAHFRGPAASNPKLVSYLAAGGIQGLRPLRYEKRVARNRFIALVIFLFLVLLGIIAVFLKSQ